VLWPKSRCPFRCLWRSRRTRASCPSPPEGSRASRPWCSLAPRSGGGARPGGGGKIRGACVDTGLHEANLNPLQSSWFRCRGGELYGRGSGERVTPAGPVRVDAVPWFKCLHGTVVGERGRGRTWDMRCYPMGSGGRSRGVDQERTVHRGAIRHPGIIEGPSTDLDSDQRDLHRRALGRSVQHEVGRQGDQVGRTARKHDCDGGLIRRSAEARRGLVHVPLDVRCNLPGGQDDRVLVPSEPGYVCRTIDREPARRGAGARAGLDPHGSSPVQCACG
jgi:hypothetical protein